MSLSLQHPTISSFSPEGIQLIFMSHFLCWPRMSKKCLQIFQDEKSEMNIINYRCKSGNLFQNFCSVHVSNESGCFITHQSSSDVLWLSCVRRNNWLWLLKAWLSTELLLSSIYYTNILEQILAIVFHQGNWVR